MNRIQKHIVKSYNNMPRDDTNSARSFCPSPMHLEEMEAGLVKSQPTTQHKVSPSMERSEWPTANTWGQTAVSTWVIWTVRPESSSRPARSAASFIIYHSTNPLTWCFTKMIIWDPTFHIMVGFYFKGASSKLSLIGTHDQNSLETTAPLL